MIEMCCEYLSVWGALTVCFYYVTCAFIVNLHPEVACMSRNTLLETGAISENSVTATGLRA